MKLASIVPAKMAEHIIAEDDNYHLIIAPEVLNNPTYREFYRARGVDGDFVILDNGAYEQHIYGREADLSPEFLIKAVSALGFLPGEIVLPDVPGSAHNTLMASTKAGYALREEWRYVEFMAVPHAESLSDYLQVAHYLSNIPGMRAFGVPFIAAQALGVERDELVEALVKKVIQDRGIELHLLGMKTATFDSELASHVRGVDTSKHVRMGLEGRELGPHLELECDPRPKNYFDLEPKDDNVEGLELAGKNITTLRKALHHG